MSKDWSLQLNFTQSLLSALGCSVGIGLAFWSTGFGSVMVSEFFTSQGLWLVGLGFVMAGEFFAS